MIWIICKFFPMFGAKLLGGAVGLAVSVVILALVYVYFFAPSDGEGRSEERQPAVAQKLPNRIYDGSNNPWECTWRSTTSQETDYVNKKTGETIRIYHYSISGNSAQTDKGTFRWH